MCQERTQLGRDDSDSDCDVDVPTTRVWPWWVELCQLPVTLSPLRCPSPTIANPFPTFLCISHWVSHAKVATFDFSVSAAAGNPVPHSQSFYFLVFCFSFSFCCSPQATTENMLHIIFHFSIFHLHFPFVSIHFEIFSQKNQRKLPPTGKMFYFYLLALFSVCACVC